MAAESAAAAIERLDGIAHRLRLECPWDREQDERSIVSHTVEEAYELADAAATGESAKLLDELGDVLFQVVFLALLAEERGEGDLSAVAEAVTEKLIRRHPHVFGGEEAEDAEQVRLNWDRIKRESEGRGAGTAEDVPRGLPSLLYARKLMGRAEVADGERADGEELARRVELDAERVAGRLRSGSSASPGSAAGERDDTERALGGLLMSCVAAASALEVDPELALRERARDLAHRHQAPDAP